MQTKGKSTATQVEAKNTSSRGRKRKQSSKMREHVEQLMEIARRKKSKQVIDENGDIDFPVIRTVSILVFL
jgi:ribosome biogenesis protein Nip4